MGGNCTLGYHMCHCRRVRDFPLKKAWYKWPQHWETLRSYKKYVPVNLCFGRLNWFKQYLFIHTVQWCNKHIYYNHQFSIKNLLAKPPSSSRRKKAQKGKEKIPPQLHHAGSTPTQSSPPGRRGIIASTSSPYSNCMSTTLAVRAQDLHIRLWW